MPPKGAAVRAKAAAAKKAAAAAKKAAAVAARAALMGNASDSSSEDEARSGDAHASGGGAGLLPQKRKRHRSTGFMPKLESCMQGVEFKGANLTIAFKSGMLHVVANQASTSMSIIWFYLCVSFL